MDQNLNGRSATLKLTKKKVRKILQDTGIDKDLLNRTLAAEETMPTVGKWDLIKVLSSSAAKGRQQ